MRRIARENALCASMAGAGSAAMAWLGLYGFAWNDYDNEARPAVDALVHGHVLEFLRIAPAYGGSLIERAPFALLPGLWGGGQLAMYRMLALPCLLAAAMLGMWLVGRMRANGRSTLSWGVALGLCVANPLTLRALELGHPEELLGACLCVAAVLLASRDRPLLAAATLGMAIANKEWALLAAGPIILALPAKRRLSCIALAAVTAAAIMAPLALVSSGSFVTGARGAAAPPATIFQPWQAWWFLGHHGALVHGLFGAPKPGYRVGPSWVGMVSHPLILLTGLALTATLWLTRRWRSGAGARLLEPDALLALALLLLLRCILDTWDTVYYLLPFVFALLAWEVGAFSERPPLLTLSLTALAWIGFEWLPTRASADAQAAFFLAWSLPLAVSLAFASCTPGRVLVDERKLLRQARKPLVPAVTHQS
ncbi:MAG TPA: glycosyltransferase 87 family protein [Solirubrobacteraceae bacterium]|nr:glycosyltransferase 87 family protein [Solirubrobacteraceae bacterium]